MTLDIEQVALTMTAKEQKKLFKYVATWISAEDVQRVMDHLAQMIVKSRARAAVCIARGEWPIQAPLKRDVLNRFIDAMPKNVLSVCKTPTFIEDEKE